MQKTLLIADAGSSKTEWWCNGRTVSAQGINPVIMTEEEIRKIISDIRVRIFEDSDVCVSEIHFYGAGCTPEKSPVLEKLLGELFTGVEISVNSDLLGAARALCGHRPGVACILGTGANSCLYDGERIVGNTPALGFILGDEGSGAVLGKLFLNALFKGRLDKEIADDFKVQYNIDMAEIINRVYRQPMPNRFLASLSPFIGRHKGNETLRQLIEQNFRDFFRHNILPYDKARLLPINFVGSIAWHYQDILKSVAAAEGYCIGKIIKSPIKGMVDYHLGNF